MFKNRRVVVTGLGPLCAIGAGKDEVWNSLIHYKTNIELDKAYIGDEYIGSFYKHKINNFDIHNYDIH